MFFTYKRRKEHSVCYHTYYKYKVFFLISQVLNKLCKSLLKFLKKHNNGILGLKDGANIIECHNCGASIDVTSSKCEYRNNLQEWLLIDKK